MHLEGVAHLQQAEGDFDVSRTTILCYDKMTIHVFAVTKSVKP